MGIRNRNFGYSILNKGFFISEITNYDNTICFVDIQKSFFQISKIHLWIDIQNQPNIIFDILNNQIRFRSSAKNDGLFF